MEVLRTPDARFDRLPGYDFAPSYAEVPDGDGGTLRMHYVDAGPRGGEVVVALHGEPSWSYLYRSMVGVFTGAGLRVVAPDLVGFGRSDKPAAVEDYTYARHTEWVRALLFDVLDLHDVTLVCQDWGGLLGLRLVGTLPDRFARVSAANTYLPAGDRSPGEAFLAWREYALRTEDLPVGQIVQSASVTQLPPEVVAAYDAPFPDASYKAGARAFPALVPVESDDPGAVDNRVAWQGLSQFDRPFLTCFGDSDPITRGADRVLQKLVPGAAGQPHVTLAGAGHFLQEDVGEEWARHTVELIERTAPSTGDAAGAADVG